MLVEYGKVLHIHAKISILTIEITCHMLSYHPEIAFCNIFVCLFC